jgi:hypothetical protein
MTDIVEIEWDKEKAEQFTKGMHKLKDTLMPKLNSFVNSQAYRCLDKGYTTFEEWWVGEGLSELKLSASDRRIAIEQLKEEKPEISVREIGEILDVPKSTVQRDIGTVPNGTLNQSGENSSHNDTNTDKLGAEYSAPTQEKILTKADIDKKIVALEKKRDKVIAELTALRAERENLFS